MAARKSLLGPPPQHPELERLLERTSVIPVTDDQLQDQRVSFAYGNAPEKSRITKESVLDASRRMRIAQ